MMWHDAWYEWYKIRCVDMIHNPGLCMKSCDENDMIWRKMEVVVLYDGE